MTRIDNRAPIGTVNKAVLSTFCVARGSFGSTRRHPLRNPSLLRNKIVVLMR